MKKKAKKAKRATRSKPASRKKASSKRPVKKKSVKKIAAKKAAAKKTAKKKRRVVRLGKAQKRARPQIVPFEEPSTRPRSGAQAGDLQGLRTNAGASSESVDELVEEGNAFEADAVAGVERADDEDEGEVRTHEVSEDDVPEEYLDKD